MTRHLRLLDFALFMLGRQRTKTAVIVVVYALLVGLVGSLLLFVSSLRREARLLLAEAPEIVVQRMRGGRHDLMPIDRATTLGELRGVASVTPRSWGYSYDPPTRAVFTVWGADTAPSESLELLEGEWLDGKTPRTCLVGNGVAELRFLGLGDRLPMLGSQGDLFAPRVVGIFAAESGLLTHDLVVLPVDDVRRLFDIPADTATDLAVRVTNPREVDTVAIKIQELWPDVRVITREQLIATYDAVFDWRSGVWFAALLGALLAFGILTWDQATGLSAEESRTLGILKALGWTSRDVLELKLYEGLLVSTISLLGGWILAEIHLYWLDGVLFAKVLQGWSVLYPSFELHPASGLWVWMLCALLIVVPYLAARVLPSWRAAITDPAGLIGG